MTYGYKKHIISWLLRDWLIFMGVRGLSPILIIISLLLSFLP